MLEQLVYGQADVFSDLAQQDWRDIATGMNGDSGGPAIRVPKLLVRAALPRLDETKPTEQRNHLARL